jgi:hypothetical protein
MDTRLGEILDYSVKSKGRKTLLLGPFTDELHDAFKQRSGSIDFITGDGANTAGNLTYDSVVMLQPAAGSDFPLDRACKYVRPDGELFLIHTGCAKTSRIARAAAADEMTSRLERNGFEVRHAFGIAPSIDDFRLMVPLSNHAVSSAALALYQPSLQMAKARKLLAYMLARAGMSRLWTPVVLFIAGKADAPGECDTLRIIKKISGAEVETALFTGTPGYLRKPTLQVMRKSGRILGFAKLAITKQTKELLENEYNTLLYVNKLDLGCAGVPGISYYGDCNEEIRMLFQSSDKTPLSSSYLKPTEKHFEFLARLHDQTGTKVEDQKEKYFCGIEGRIEALKGKIPHSLLFLLTDSLAIIGASLRNEKVRFGLAHRDFTPWNTYLSGKKIVIFDWEFAERAWPPLHDAMHFIIQKGILVDRAPAGKLLKRVLQADSVEGRFIESLRCCIGLAKACLSFLLLAYLLDMITAYSINNLACHSASNEDRLIMSTWQAMLVEMRSALSI